MSEGAAYAAEEERPCQCQAYLRATERAALVSARWLGRADEDAAEEAAATATSIWRWIRSRAAVSSRAAATARCR